MYTNRRRDFVGTITYVYNNTPQSHDKEKITFKKNCIFGQQHSPHLSSF